MIERNPPAIIINAFYSYYNDSVTERFKKAIDYYTDHECRDVSKELAFIRTARTSLFFLTGIYLGLPLGVNRFDLAGGFIALPIIMSGISYGIFQENKFVRFEERYFDRAIAKKRTSLDIRNVLKASELSDGARGVSAGMIIGILIGELCTLAWK